jgi:hypothetical protein
MKKIIIGALLGSCFVAAAQADTFDLHCVVKGDSTLGIIDTNAAGQQAFGQEVRSSTATDDRIVVNFKVEQLIVMRSDNSVFVDGELMPDATCEVKNYLVVAPTEQQLKAANDSGISSGELDDLNEKIKNLQDENKKLSDLLYEVIDIVEYIADKNISANERVIEKLLNVVD